MEPHRVIEQILNNMCMPNTGVVKEATRAMNEALKDPNTLFILLRVVQEHPGPHIRQLAAVVMRYRVVSLWSKIRAESDREQVRTALLNVLATDDNRLVRLSTADLVSVLAKTDFLAGKWPSLIHALFELSTSANAGHREIGIKLFDFLTDTIGDALRTYFMKLVEIFAAGLQDEDFHVRVAALRAVVSLVEWAATDEEIRAYGELIPLMIRVVGHCLEAGADEAAGAAFESFNELLESPIPVVVPHLSTLINAVLQIGANTALDLNTRENALTVVQWAVMNKPRPLLEFGLVDPCLRVAFQLCAETPTDDILALPAHVFGSQIIDYFASSMGASRILPQCLECVNTYITSAQAVMRISAFYILTVLSEGCAQELSENIDKLIPYLESGVRDSDARVRQAVCLCIGQWAKHLQPEFSAYHKPIITVLAQLMANAPDEDTQCKICYAVDEYCLNLTADQVNASQSVLLPPLFGLVERGTSLAVKENAVGAISSIAASAEGHFMPYHEMTMKMVMAFMSLVEEETLQLRCKATEAAGVIAASIGPEAFHPYVATVMDYACQGMDLEYAELKEYTHGAFANLAACYGEHFAPFAAAALTYAEASCETTDGVINMNREAQLEGLDVDVEASTHGKTNVGVPESFMNEKAAACHAMAEIAGALGTAYEPYLIRSIDVLTKMATYYHTSTRQNAHRALFQVAKLTYAAAPPPQGAYDVEDKSTPMESLPPLTGPTQEIISHVMKVLLFALGNDKSPVNVAKAMGHVGALCTIVGPRLFHSPEVWEEFCTIVMGLLGKTMPCHNVADRPFSDEEATMEMDIAFMDAVIDGLIDVSKALKSEFAALLEQMYDSLISYFPLALEFQVQIIGLFAEAVPVMGEKSRAFLERFIPLMMASLESENAVLTRNGSYFCGILFECDGAGDLIPVIPDALRLLVPLSAGGEDASMDNACAALARMMLRYPRDVPMEHVLPHFLGALPLRSDHSENPTVYKVLFQLFMEGHSAVVPHIETCVRVLSAALCQPQLQEEIRSATLRLLSQLLKAYPEPIRALVASLPPQQQSNLTSIM